MQHVRANASNNYDKIHPTWIKNLTSTHKQELLSCYNRAWAISTFHNVWKCSSLLTILKKNKPKYKAMSVELLSVKY